MFIFLASGLNVFIQQFVQNLPIFEVLGPIITFFLGFLPFVLIWFLFTILYIIMPNTRVHFRWALIAGIVSGTAFQLLQWAYINFQAAFSRYNAIYGAFAALPLFLLWMQISWIIVLVGAEIAFAYQNIGKYELETDSKDISHKIRKLLSILVVHKIVNRFSSGEQPLNTEELSDELELPRRYVNSIIYPLVESNILSEVSTPDPKEVKFQPAIDINLITIAFVIQRLEEIGDSDLHVRENDTFHKLVQTQKQFNTLIENADANKLIKEL
jgi:membrane protein